MSVSKLPPADVSGSAHGDARHEFIEYLAREGLKLTQQRLTILDVLLETSGHYTLEEMYHKVAEMDPAVSQATVYRTLRLFVDAGFAYEVTFGDGLTRYELRYGQCHHDHIICRQCGRSVEFLNPALERMLEDISRQYDFIQTSHALNIFGMCDACRRAERRKLDPPGAAGG